MSAPKMTVRARVVLTLEIVAHSRWGLEVTAEQVHRQALDDVKQAMRLGLAVEGLVSGGGTNTGATIVGEPKVTMVIADWVRGTE